MATDPMAADPMATSRSLTVLNRAESVGAGRGEGSPKSMAEIPEPRNDPTEFDREFFRRSFVGCVITDAEGHVLLVHTTYGQKKWEVPGGVLETGEAPWEAVRRETREEVGLELGELTLTGVYFMAHRDSFGFMFRADAFSGTIRPDGVEVDEARFFAPTDLPSPMSVFARERILDALGGGPLTAVRGRLHHLFVIVLDFLPRLPSFRDPGILRRAAQPARPVA